MMYNIVSIYTIFILGYTLYYGQYCLYIGGGYKTWYDAKSDCASRTNGWLISITDAHKNDIVFANNGYNEGWIGGTRTSVSSNWTWDHGESYSYNHIGYDDKQELCLFMSYTRVWHDFSCSINKPYICENTNKCPAGMYYYYIYIYFFIYNNIIF